jgi:hypothetical protein
VYLGHLGHRQAGVAQQLGGAAGGQQLDALRMQRAGEFDDAGLVGNGHQGGDGNCLACYGGARSVGGSENGVSLI